MRRVASRPSTTRSDRTDRIDEPRRPFGHLARRVFGEAEDGRYAEMREDLGDRFDSWMLLFFQIQALLAAGLGLVFLLPMSDPEASWRIWDVVAPGLWLVAVLGQAVADRQLSRWKSDRRKDQ